jgi:hypothetical protein
MGFGEDAEPEGDGDGEGMKNFGEIFGVLQNIVYICTLNNLE